MMPGLVYILCALTSLGSAVLLWRAVGKPGNGLLFWSGVCFLGMAINNVLMYIDSVLFPTFYMYELPNIVALVSIIILSLALIWHST
jgi:hypothetical protein